MRNMDDTPRVKPSGRNGNRLPLRQPGERIGGRKKGTPNKMSRDLKEAIIAAGHEAGIRLCEPGSFYGPPPSPEDLHEYLVWLALNKTHIYGRLLARTLPRKRGRSQCEHSMRDFDEPFRMRDPDEPFRSWEEFEQAAREAGISVEALLKWGDQVSSNQEVKKPA